MSLTRTMKAVQTLEAGTYKVMLMDLKETQLEAPSFGTGDVIRFVLETVDVLDAESNPIELDGIANDKLTPLSKLTRWLAAFGVTATPGEDVDMEEAVGREAMAVVVLKPGKDGTGSFPRIDDLVPLPKSGRPVTASVDPLTAFWARVKAVGYDPKTVAPYVNNDLTTLVQKTPDELDALMKEMGA